MSNMRVLTLKPLRLFWARYPDAETPLRQWFKTATESSWTNLVDIRRVYPHADAVRVRSGTLTVFNICGNKYRLIVRIKYEWQMINVRSILTHAEYNLNRWKES